MLKESLKYFFLTLIAAACLIFGAVCFRQYLSEKNQPYDPPFDMVSAAAYAATPDVEELSGQNGAGEATPENTPIPTPAPTPAPTPESFESRLRRSISSMSLEEKIGQLMMFGFSGTTAPDAKYLQIFRDYQIGNFLLLGPNIDRKDSSGGFETCRILTSALQQEERIPALISIDVEGGKVIRFQWDQWPESAASLGKKGDMITAEEQFLRIAVQLRNSGINVDLAPVLDISENPLETVLKTRIISSDTDTVSAIGTSVIRGIQEGGCLSAAKHFPGHGGTTADSHDKLPVIRKSLDELMGYDLVPFRAAVDAGVDLVLIAHILYPEIDPDQPASLSERFMTDLLREEMGFEGIIISDDFRMKGLTDGRTVGDAAVRFLLAGGDMILCGPNSDYQKQIAAAVTEAAEQGILSQDRIDESMYRILLKKHLVTDWEPDN